MLELVTTPVLELAVVLALAVVLFGAGRVGKCNLRLCPTILVTSVDRGISQPGIVDATSDPDQEGAMRTAQG